MASASDYDFVDFSEAAPADLNHYLCNSGNFSKLYLTGKDYAWSLEAVKERLAVSHSKSSLPKTPYSPTISSANWNEIVTDFNSVLSSRIFLRSLTHLVDATRQPDQELSPFLDGLDYHTESTAYVGDRLAFSSGENLSWKKIADLENSLLKLHTYVINEGTFTAEVAQYKVTDIFPGVPFTYPGGGVVYRHSADVSPSSIASAEVPGRPVKYSVGHLGERKAILRNGFIFKVRDWYREDSSEMWGIFRIYKKKHIDWFTSDECVIESQYWLINLGSSGGYIRLAYPQQIVDRLVNLSGIADDISHPLQTEDDVKKAESLRGYYNNMMDSADVFHIILTGVFSVCNLKDHIISLA